MTDMTAVRSAHVNGWRIALWTSIAAVLLTPLIAMQFTREVDWTGSDFALAAILLGGAGLVYELAARRSPDARRKLVIGGGLLVVVVLIWLQGAVGIV